MTRAFVLVGHEAPTTPDFALEGLPGTGRLDLLARSLIAGLLTSHDIRAGASVTLVLGDEVAVRFDGNELQGLHPDERSAAALIRTALEAARDAVGPLENEVRPGTFVSKRGVEQVVRDLANEGTVVQLHEDGLAAGDTEPPADPVFVLSDHRDFSTEEQTLLVEVADEQVSLGPVPIHADQAVAVANNWVDTEGFRRY